MSTIGVRELARNASAIINELDATKQPALITRRGRPVAYILPVDSEQFEDFVLANAPEFVEGMAAADRELLAGETTSLAAARRLLEDDADLGDD
ncbi:type II toxin-antitoxin system Phd/YefM family antitoxin [Conexibacter sp. JD483]|uniref:type II toxin-antitoxin system Phd/YefM family antitoxin n=1 Tax=unclassified Conexibacter TaxID=2627773 RepID=UPI002725D690|nr:MULTISPECIES: type II toxin-antitoxin system Phd/YefM family antitoxin [unclassified Conexibacter]MDO8187284.1 type II toxin-antitoxin system Phd/YefM family antitoxin [Conexibacter sp. CPCC 205706]MDO8198893.1 type II toxin-antitoxin system Phd/YefM family antitoxin [Conexibacter sp. CPCC 205762]MDR9370632.1 type II toxin-antitoxin system Phd/YefM family antitoxin [Conexibacter sp. JD483]